MKGNGNRLRREYKVDNEACVLVKKTARFIVLERLDGSLADYRRRLGLKQGEMAEKLGVSQGALSKMESGTLKVRPEIEARCRQIVAQAAKA